MLLGFFLSLFLLGVLSKDAPLPQKTNVQLHPQTTLVIWGTRHGNRNPEKLVKTSNGTWGQEGDLELTSVGKRQAYGLGKEIRAFIGDKLVEANYRPSQAKFYSSSANRCQMTLQTAVAGLYPPTGWADWNRPALDNWSPVPYTIDDPLLRMYSVKGCVESDKAWEPISKDTLPDLAKLAKDNSKLLNYMKEKDGRDATISNAADIADNILNMDFFKVPYPEWLSKPSLPGYDAKKIREAYLAFAENHMNRCATHKPCRNMMGGYWANHILTSLEDAKNGKGPKVIGYASHTEVTLATMLILGIEKEELTTSAGFVIEYRKNGDLVRVLQHDPNPIDQHVIYSAKLISGLGKSADKQGWIKVADFKKFVSANSFSDWRKECKITTCA